MMAVPLLAAAWLLGTLERGVLLAVQINPEARVKAQRGPALPRLVGETAFLVRVDNEAGATALVRLLSPHTAAAGQAADRDRWLRAELTTLEGGAPRLTGRRREYLLLRLETDQRGRREASLTVDIGQGTQDLGFRAEVTILFGCGPPPAPPPAGEGGAGMPQSCAWWPSARRFSCSATRGAARCWGSSA